MIYDDLAFAVTHCGLSPTDFARLTTEEWHAIATMQLKREEQEAQTSWEQARSIMYASVVPHLSSPISAPEAFPLPWDTPREEAPPDIMTPEELRAIEERYR